MKLNMEQGKYKIYEVGEEIIISDSKEKIKKYAVTQGLEKITYKISVNNIKGLLDNDKYKQI